MELTCLNRNFCSSTDFLCYLPRPISANVSMYVIWESLSKKLLKTDYLQKFMLSLIIFCAGILVWAPKFCSRIYEKQFIQISGDKVFIAIVSKHCSIFNINLFSKNNQNCFAVMSPSVFRPQLPFDFCFTKNGALRLRVTYIHD